VLRTKKKVAHETIAALADLGERPRRYELPLSWMKKEEITEAKKEAALASETKLPPPLGQGLDPPLIRVS